MELTRFLNTLAYRYAWKFIELPTILILAALVGPYDFGMAFVYMVIVYMITRFLVVNYSDQSSHQVRLFYNTYSIISPLSAFVVAGVVFLIGILSSNIPLRLAGIITLLSILTLPAETFFFGRHQLNKIYFANIISQLLMSMLSITLAIFGFGYLSILYGYILFYGAKTVLLWRNFPLGLQPEVSVLMLTNIIKQWLNNITQNLAEILVIYGPIIIALFFGYQELGYLYLGIYLAYFAYENVTIFINSLLVEKFIDTHNIDLVRLNISRLIEYYGVIIVPFCSILIVLSNLIARILLGVEWIGMTEILGILLFSGMIKGIVEASRLAYIKMKKIKSLTRIRYIEFAALTLFLILTHPIKTTGIAISVLLSTLFASALLMAGANSVLKFDIFALSRDFLYVLISGLITVLLLGLLKEVIFIDNYFTLVLMFLTGIVIYIVSTFLFNHELYKRFVRFIFSFTEASTKNK